MRLLQVHISIVQEYSPENMKIGWTSFNQYLKIRRHGTPGTPVSVPWSLLLILGLAVLVTLVVISLNR